MYVYAYVKVKIVRKCTVRVRALDGNDVIQRGGPLKQ